MRAITKEAIAAVLETTAKPQPLPEHRSAWSPLREPLFRSLWIAAVISYTGSWMQNVATGWLMTSLTRSPVLVALVQVAISVPVFVIALPAGALADILDRRKFLLWTQSFMVAAAALLGVLTLTGSVTPQLLLVFTFLLGVGAVMNDPGWQALTPEIVSRQRLQDAVALNSAGFNMARAAGPALGGLVIATAGSGEAFLLNAISFFGVILFLYRWKPAEQANHEPERNIWLAVRVGLSYARQDKQIKAVLARTLAFSFPASGFWALLPLIARKHGALGYGAMLAYFGLGALAGAAVLPRIRRACNADLLIVFATVIVAIALFGLVRTESLAISSALLFAAGLGWIGALATLNAVAQTVAPSWVRARTISLYVLALQGGLAIGSIVCGIVAANAGLTVALTGSAAALIFGLVLGLWYRLHRAHESPSAIR